MDCPMGSLSEVNKDCSEILYLFTRFSFHISRELANLVFPFCFCIFILFLFIYNCLFFQLHQIFITRNLGVDL